MLEVDLHAEGEAVAGIELPLVVVAEPMALRAAGDGADWREIRRVRLSVELVEKIGCHGFGRYFAEAEIRFPRTSTGSVRCTLSLPMSSIRSGSS